MLTPDGHFPAPTPILIAMVVDESMRTFGSQTDY